MKRKRTSDSDRPLLRMLAAQYDDYRPPGLSPLACEGDDQWEAALDSEELEALEEGHEIELDDFQRFRGELYRLLAQIDQPDLTWPSARQIEEAITARLQPEDFVHQVLREYAN